MLHQITKLAIATLTNIAVLSSGSLLLAQTSAAQTAFYVAANGRTGRVNYDIQLNSDCSPVQDQPVHSYYRNSNGSTRPLSQMEQEGYSIASQSVVGNTVTLTIGALQHYGIEKPIAITTSRLANGMCQTHAVTDIDGAQAQLAYIQLEVNRRQLFGQTIGVEIIGVSLISINQRSETIACSSNCRYGF